MVFFAILDLRKHARVIQEVNLAVRIKWGGPWMIILFRTRELIWGGGEVFLFELMNQFVKSGHEVRLSSPPLSAIRQRMAFETIGETNSKRFDLVVCNDFRSVWKSVAVDRSIRRVFIVHGSWQLSKVRVIFCNMFDVPLLVVNKRLLNEALGLGAKNAGLLPIGRARKKKLAKSESSDAKSHFRFATVSRLDPVKNLELYGNFCFEQGAASLLVTYEPSSVGQELLLAKIKSQGGSFLHISTSGDPEMAWHNTDFYLNTSESESLGISMLEALDQGIPVVATRTQGSEEILTGALSVGLADHAVEGLERAYLATRAYLSSDESWKYWSAAEALLDSRGPEQCANRILEVLQ